MLGEMVRNPLNFSRTLNCRCKSFVTFWQIPSDWFHLLGATQLYCDRIQVLALLVLQIQTPKGASQSQLLTPICPFGKLCTIVAHLQTECTFLHHNHVCLVKIYQDRKFPVWKSIGHPDGCLRGRWW